MIGKYTPVQLLRDTIGVTDEEIAELKTDGHIECERRVDGSEWCRLTHDGLRWLKAKVN